MKNKKRIIKPALIADGISFIFLLGIFVLIVVLAESWIVKIIFIILIALYTKDMKANIEKTKVKK